MEKSTLNRIAEKLKGIEERQEKLQQNYELVLEALEFYMEYKNDSRNMEIITEKIQETLRRIK